MSKNYVEPDQIRLLKMKNLDCIKLNVGGHKFQTSADTLRMYDSFFSTLISSDIPQKVDADNYVFIDRNGENFGKILDFMRMKTIDFGHNIDLAKAIRVEADFYQFQELIEKCDEFIASPAANIFAYERTVYTKEERDFMIATGKPIVFVAIGGSYNGFISPDQDTFYQAIGASSTKLMNLRKQHPHINFIMDYTPTTTPNVFMNFFFDKRYIQNIEFFKNRTTINISDIKISAAINFLNGKMIQQLTQKLAAAEAGNFCS